MNNQNALFAQALNKVVNSLIEPEVEACRQELIAAGALNNEKVEEVLSKAKAQELNIFCYLP